MSKTSAWVIADRERRELNGLPDDSTPDDSDWNWEAEYAEMIASGDPERLPGHAYATERESRERTETTTTVTRSDNPS